MIIANIVSNDSINIGPEFNVVQSMDDITNKELPTLIIGQELAKLVDPNCCKNILNRQISDNLFWTLRRNFKRDTYSSDLEKFIRHSYENYIKNIKYIDIDFIQYSKPKMDKVKTKLWSLDNTICYKSSNNIIYVYSENLIFGIDLNLAEYVGLNIEKIERKLNQKSSVFLEGNEILIEYNNHLERLNYEIKYIPVLYSINPHE